MTRRVFLASALAVPPDCCRVPEAAPDTVRIQPGLLTLDLRRVLALHGPGAAVAVTDAARKLQIVIARPSKNRFVALDRKCTHGGGPLTYVPKHQHLYCTCWGHARFALDGAVLRWPNKQTPRPLRGYTVERRGNLLHIHIPELA
jgi:nitrite reductase/ring-hydroxylating ferredoxin subunit